jgi:hypothetical protein
MLEAFFRGRPTFGFSTPTAFLEGATCVLLLLDRVAAMSSSSEESDKPSRRVVGKYFERDRKVLLGQRFELLVGQLLFKLHTRELDHVNRRDVINGLDATSKQIKKNHLTNIINILEKKHRKQDGLIVGHTYKMAHANNALVNLKK